MVKGLTCIRSYSQPIMDLYTGEVFGYDLLKSKAKEINYAHLKSGYLFERRIYEEEMKN